MKSILPVLVFALITIFTFNQCEQAVGKDGWLSGSTNEKLDKVATHLRGNDLVMMEVDYRYKELFAAGLDNNWDYASYQLTKLRLAMEMGKERRPGRSESFKWFFENGFIEIDSVVIQKDSISFLPAFEAFTKACNTCHALEELTYFNVVIPTKIESVIQLK